MVIWIGMQIWTACWHASNELWYRQHRNAQNATRAFTRLKKYELQIKYFINCASNAVSDSFFFESMFKLLHEYWTLKDSCNKRLESNTLTEHQGELHCRSCYAKHFGPKGYGNGYGLGTMPTENGNHFSQNGSANHNSNHASVDDANTKNT